MFKGERSADQPDVKGWGGLGKTPGRFSGPKQVNEVSQWCSSWWCGTWNLGIWNPYIYSCDLGLKQVSSHTGADDDWWKLKTFLKLNSFTIIYPEHFWSWSNWWSCCLLWRWTNHKSKIKNKKWFIPRDLSVLLQPADIVSKFRKQLKNVRSHKDFLLGWSIQLDRRWSIQFDPSWSIRWQFDQMISTISLTWSLINLIKWSGMQFHRGGSCINMWFECVWCDVWYITMWLRR